MSWIEIIGLFSLISLGLFIFYWSIMALLVLRWFLWKSHLTSGDLIELRGNLCSYEDDFNFPERDYLMGLVKKRKKEKDER